MRGTGLRRLFSTRDVVVVWLVAPRAEEWCDWDGEPARAWSLRDSPQPQRSWRPLDKARFEPVG